MGNGCILNADGKFVHLVKFIREVRENSLEYDGIAALAISDVLSTVLDYADDLEKIKPGDDSGDV
jgi:hypothetical protein